MYLWFAGGELSLITDHTCFFYISEPAECLPSRRGCRHEWLIVRGPLWRLPRGPSIQRGSWNIRSWLTRLWSSSPASLLPQCEPQDLRGAQLGRLKKSGWMVLETLQLLLPCALSPLALNPSTATISDTVFFTWYVHLCLPKPLETILKSAFHIFNQKASSVEEFVQHFHYPLSPSLSCPLFFPPQPSAFPRLFPARSHTS